MMPQLSWSNDNFPLRESRRGMVGNTALDVLTEDGVDEPRQADQIFQPNIRTEGATQDLGKRIMPETPSREEIKAEISASEARTDTKFEKLNGTLSVLLSRLDDVRSGQRAAIANSWVIGLGLAVLIVGVVALFPIFFGFGEHFRELINEAVQKSLSAPK